MKASQEPTAEGQISEKENLSMDEFIALRIAQEESTEAEESEPESEPSETDENEEEVEGIDQPEESQEEESEEEEETEAEQGEEIDLDQLTPEQIQDIAKKGKSRLLGDLGKLRAEKRELERQLAQVQSAQGQKTKEIPVAANPFGNLKTIEEIRQKSEQLEATLETTDRILEEYEDYGPEDAIQVEGKMFTKKQIRQANRNAREAITKFLPAQEKHLEKLESMEKAHGHYVAQAEKEIPEIKDDKSEIGKLYQTLVRDPLVQQVKEKLPELGFQMEYLLAHVARSIKSTVKNVPKGAGSKLKVKLPASPVSSAGPKGSAQKSKVASLRARYEKTGSQADWQALRLAEMGQ